MRKIALLRRINILFLPLFTVAIFCQAAEAAPIVFDSIQNRKVFLGRTLRLRVRVREEERQNEKTETKTSAATINSTETVTAVTSQNRERSQAGRAAGTGRAGQGGRANAPRDRDSALEDLDVTIRTRDLPGNARFKDLGNGFGVLRWTPVARAEIGDHIISFRARGKNKKVIKEQVIIRVQSQDVARRRDQLRSQFGDNFREVLRERRRARRLARNLETLAAVNNLSSALEAEAPETYQSPPETHFVSHSKSSFTKNRAPTIDNTKPAISISARLRGPGFRNNSNNSNVNERTRRRRGGSGRFFADESSFADEPQNNQANADRPGNGASRGDRDSDATTNDNNANDGDSSNAVADNQPSTDIGGGNTPAASTIGAAPVLTMPQLNVVELGQTLSFEINAQDSSDNALAISAVDIPLEAELTSDTLDNGELNASLEWKPEDAGDFILSFELNNGEQTIERSTVVSVLPELVENNDPSFSFVNSETVDSISITEVDELSSSSTRVDISLKNNSGRDLELSLESPPEFAELLTMPEIASFNTESNLAIMLASTEALRSVLGTQTGASGERILGLIPITLTDSDSGTVMTMMIKIDSAI